MKSQELRIGNYVDRKGNLMEVRGIHNTKIALYDTVSKSYHKKWFKLDKWVKPIPITEEWLFKLGFEKLQKEAFKNSKTYQIGIERDRIIWCENMILKPLPDGNIIISEHCEFVHRLQNLYLDLTVKELKLKDE